MAIDKEKLKWYAELLESEINKYKGESKDARFLADYDELQKDIYDAKEGRVSQPRWDHGLGYWIDERSKIREHPSLSNALSEFILLLGGLKLPEGQF